MIQTIQNKTNECQCGCGGTTRGGRYLPGHDARRRSALLAAIQGGDLEAATTLKELGWDRHGHGKAKEKMEKVIKPVTKPTTNSITWNVTFTYCDREYKDKYGADAPETALFGVCGVVARRMNRRSIQEGMDKNKIDPREMVKQVTNIQVEQVGLVENVTLTRKDVEDVAHSVIPTIVRLFYPSNRAAYKRLQFEPSDIEQHLWEKVALKKYAPMIEKYPQYYRTINCLRKSFYMAAKNCCFAHHRMHIGSIMRGRILHCQVLELDHPETQSVGLASDIGHSGTWQSKMLAIVAGAPDHDVGQMLDQLCRGHIKNRSELRKEMGFTESKFAPLWDRMKSYMSQWVDDLRESAERSDQLEPTLVHVNGVAAEEDIEDCFIEHDEHLDEE